MSRLTDTLLMLDMLSTRSIVSIQELAQEFNVTPRTVQRMRDDLEYIGYRIETIMGPGGGYRLMNSSQIHPLAFTTEEINHVRQGLETLLSQQDTSFGSDFVRAISKLYHQFDLSGNHVSVSAFKSVRLNVDGVQYQTHIKTLEQAIEHHQRVSITYQKNPRQTKSYIFEPYELILVDQIWYVHGYIKNSHQVSFRVSRLVSVDLLDESYLVDTQYSSKGVMSDFGFKINPVRLKVLISSRDYFSEYIWGDDQRIEWLDDKQYVLEVTFPNKFVAKSFILEGGSSMAVIEPESLVSWIKEEAQKIIQTYL
ncbi:hypothetical protein AOC36_09850 [Erysipelothrix larvae]|uniref:HTH deoR-type domain-containing protein n=1 Tax=Erysipelothrix larvae TaxID=1514105 RepID=A0A0X8H1B9_9FIRM|nr:WYL domain-containing protein [Erysipelothrix larvae]AMC94270.1 hypothetical protein AOC36_09850 [Erysipelothrix larvae]